MLKVLQASQLSLHEVEDKLAIEEESAANFFTEWQSFPSDLDEHERKILDQTRANFRYLVKYPPTHEEVVKMVAISPVLSVAGFFQPPFRSTAEQPIEIEALSGEEIVKGRVDVLVVNQQIWIAAVESKGPQFSWSMGLPQTLVYMASGLQNDRPGFGLISNGTEFIFVKLQSSPGKYGLSKIFSLHNPGNDLYNVVGVLRSISHNQF